MPGPMAQPLIHGAFPSNACGGGKFLKGVACTFLSLATCMGFAVLLGQMSYPNHEPSITLASHMANAPRFQSWHRWAAPHAPVAQLTPTSLSSSGLRNLLGGSLDIVKSKPIIRSSKQTEVPASKEEASKAQITIQENLADSRAVSTEVLKKRMQQADDAEKAISAAWSRASSPFHEGMIDKKILHAEYAVRGAVPERAGEIAAKLRSGDTSYPFQSLILANIGNPQAVGQMPITFYRQVAAAVLDPSLLAGKDIKEDVKTRAEEYLGATNGGVGAYTDSNGLMFIRKQVAAFIQERDGFPADPNMIALTTGASEGVKRCISALISDERCGMMIPQPQYPLYSAALTMAGGRIVYYNLFEDKGWHTNGEELTRAFADATTQGTDLRAITVINPGNPVGAVMEREDIIRVIDFATENKLVILADEVYQENVYATGKQFHSFKKVLRQLQAKDSRRFEETQLISFHSTSKGVIGECGQRGGYMEFVGFSDKVMAQFSKMAATSLSSSALSQIFVGLMVRPPREGEPSYELFHQQYSAIFSGLQDRAKRLTEALNLIPGISCQAIEGAMYAFPRLELPSRAIEDAKKEGRAADEFWCLKLLEATGVVTVPGSGFGQEPGTFHFRTTILPGDEAFQDMISKIGDFQKKFLQEYSGKLEGSLD